MNVADSTAMSLTIREQFFIHQFFDLPDHIIYFFTLLVLCFLSWFAYRRGSKMNAVVSTMTVFPTRDQFLATFLRHQRFSLPDSLIYYMAKNQKSSEVYQKMIQSCKYFYIKNPILVFHCLQINDNEWKTCSDESECGATVLTKTVNINIKRLSGCKLWVDHKLKIDSKNPIFASDLIPFIYRSDAVLLDLNNQKLSFRQFLLYFRNVSFCTLHGVVMNCDAGVEVPLEEIVANLPELEGIIFEYSPESKSLSSDTVKNLLRIPHFKNLEHVLLYNISEEFDIDSFFNYYKNMDIKLKIAFNYGDDVLTEEYAAKIEEFITYVLGFPDQRPPVIFYPGQDESNGRALLKLYKKFRSV